MCARSPHLQRSTWPRRRLMQRAAKLCTSLWTKTCRQHRRTISCSASALAQCVVTTILIELSRRLACCVIQGQCHADVMGIWQTEHQQTESFVCDMLQRLQSAAAFCSVPLFGLRCKCGKSDKPVQLPLIQSVENVSTHAHSRESLAEKTLTGDKF